MAEKPSRENQYVDNLKKTKNPPLLAKKFFALICFHPRRARSKLRCRTIAPADAHLISGDPRLHKPDGEIDSMVNLRLFETTLRQTQSHPFDRAQTVLSLVKLDVLFKKDTIVIELRIVR